MGRPHLIFLMADQLRYDMLGAYGDQQCPTPKLDLLAGRSTIFEKHFTPCPLCVPARSSIHTGLWPRQHGAIINGWFDSERSYGTIRPGLPLLPQHLAKVGYRVAHVGIQHVRVVPDISKACPGVEFIGPRSTGAHHAELTNRGLMIGDQATMRDPVIEHQDGVPTTFSGTNARPAVFPLREDLYYDCALAQKMADVIDSHDPGKPLALFGMFWLPHPPLWAPQAWANLIHPDNVKLPVTVGRWYKGTPAMQLANVPGQLGAHLSIEDWRIAWASYMGMVALLDRCVGQVLAALDHVGMLNDAAVVFTSDHGEMLGSHKLFQKMCLYEESVRVPLLIKMPGQTSSRRVTEMTNHLDLTATLTDLAETAPLPNPAGASLKPLALGAQPGHPRQQIFAAYDGNAGRGFQHRMVRTPQHKYIHNIADRPELYDLVEDPRETNNLAGQPDQQETEQQLRDALNAWMDQISDDQPRAKA